MKRLSQMYLEIPTSWLVAWHHLMAIEPDNDYPISQVKQHFKENLFFAIKGSYYVSVGFIGNYEIDRSGNFILEVLEGEPYAKVLYERSITRSINEVKRRVERYMNLIDGGLLLSSQGLACDLKHTREDILFSVIDQFEQKMDKHLFDLIRNRKK